MTDKADPFDRGVVTISLDTELGWGRINTGEYDGIANRLEEGKQAIEDLLSLFDSYEIPATWAVVGQLCRYEDGSPPDTGGVDVVPDGVTVPWEQDWWHAPECVERIVASEVPHEIGSHSGNHLRFDKISPEAARIDLEAFHEWRRTVVPDSVVSFVFPHNRPGKFDHLASAGFTTYRGRPPVLGSEPTPTVFLPRRQHGLVNVPASASYRHYGGRNIALRWLPQVVKLGGLKLGVEHAARRGSVFHLVLHPNDFTLEDGRRLHEGLETWLEVVARQRERGRIEVRTMRDVADGAIFT